MIWDRVHWGPHVSGGRVPMRYCSRTTSTLEESINSTIQLLEASMVATPSLPHEWEYTFLFSYIEQIYLIKFLENNIFLSKENNMF